MKKSLILVSLALAMTSMAHASENLQNVTSQSLKSQCEVPMQKELKILPDGAEIDYRGTNEQMHQCTYMKLMVLSQCSANHDCISYEEWSRNNPRLSTNLPRYEFTKAFEMYYMHRLQGPIAIRLNDL